MRRRVLSVPALLILIGLMLVQPSDLLAQRRDRGERSGGGGRLARRPAVVAHPPAEHARVVVGSNEYHYARGVFYRVGPKGYVAIRGPVGARIRALPVGYISLDIGGAPFFFYYGTYYQLDPVTSEYAVVPPPPNAPTVPGMDKIDLITGETINGVYVGGAQNTIRVNVGGTIREIPVEQVISIVFAPAGQ